MTVKTKSAQHWNNAAGAYYDIGKDYAFARIAAHREASKEDLIAELLSKQPYLPPKLAMQTAKKIADRVFLQRSLYGDPPIP